MKKEDQQIIVGSTIVILVVSVIIGLIWLAATSQPYEKTVTIKAKPIVLPTSSEVGEGTGKVVGGFGIGVMKGLYKSVVGEKKNEIHPVEDSVSSPNSDTE
jgi:hypothetical protein